MPLSNLWDSFIEEVEKAHHRGDISSLALQRFKNGLSTLHAMGLLPLWGARYFQNDTETPFMLRWNALQETLSSVESLKDILKVHDELLQWQRQQKLFTDPATFATSWQALRNLSNEFKKGSPLMELWSQENRELEKVCLCSAMNSWISLCDSAIKEMKSSPHFSDEKKVRLLQQMLSEEYMPMVCDWLTSYAEPWLSYHNNWSLAKYLEKCKEQFDKAREKPNTLAPSRSFSVAAALVGQRTDFNRSLPQTLEDCFTLTHQNLLVSTQTLLAQQMRGKVTLPPALEKVIKQIEGMKLPVQLVGYTFTEEEVRLNYNYPLRNHSANFQVTWNKKLPETPTLAVCFAGQARERWGKLANLYRFYNAVELLPFEKPPLVQPMQLTYSHLLDTRQEDKLSLAFELLQDAATYTLDANFNSGKLSYDTLIEFVKLAKPHTQKNSNISLFVLHPRRWIQDQCVSDDLKSKKEIVLAAILLNGLALQWVSDDLKNDKEVVLAAVKQCRRVICWASEALLKDPDVRRAAGFM